MPPKTIPPRPRISEGLRPKAAEGQRPAVPAVPVWGAPLPKLDLQPRTPPEKDEEENDEEDVAAGSPPEALIAQKSTRRT